MNKENEFSEQEEVLMLISKLMKSNPKFRIHIWLSGFIWNIAAIHKQSRFSYKEFREIISKAFDLTEELWGEL